KVTSRASSRSSASRPAPRSRAGSTSRRRAADPRRGHHQLAKSASRTPPELLPQVGVVHAAHRRYRHIAIHDACMPSTPVNSGHKRILVTGGAGEMGAYACRVLAGADEVDEVLVADRDAPRAAQLAADLGPKATPLRLDISDAEALANALAGVDIV